MRSSVILLCALLLSACNSAGADGDVNVVIIGAQSELFPEGVRLSAAAQHLRGATTEGIVSLDSSGQIVPAIAERWIVTDDGLGYIFRLRASDWPDGSEISAADVRVLLTDNLRRLEGTSLGLDLAKITEVRAMTGRVIEVRLSSPMPEFLRVLAQPELGLIKDGGGAGPMIASSPNSTQMAQLNAMPPESRGLAPREDWEETARVLTVQALPAGTAVDAFADGAVDVVLNGRLTDFPEAQLGPLAQGNVRIDPTFGIFGFLIRNQSGFLARREHREALSMAIDREAVVSPFSIGGWQSTSWIIPPELLGAPEVGLERWAEQSRLDLRAIAARRVADWEASSGEKAALKIGLPEGEGSDLLFRQVAADWRDIGIDVERVLPEESPDLVLRDRLARYSSPRWFLNQFNCSLRIGLCSEAADALVIESLSALDPARKTELLADAHALLVEEEAFIPLGAPIRWSLVRGSVTSFEPNRWGMHPLFPLSQPTI